MEIHTLIMVIAVCFVSLGHFGLFSGRVQISVSELVLCEALACQLPHCKVELERYGKRAEKSSMTLGLSTWRYVGIIASDTTLTLLSR